MPSPLLQLRIPQDLADWLEAKYPSRGEVAEYVRQLLTAEQMKEAVAPLVPVELVERDGVSMTIARRGVRPEDIVIPEPKPKARRKKVPVGDLESDEPIDLMTALKASVDAMKAATIQGPARCNRGACTGTINPVSGRCLHCNQTPLKESK